MIGWTRSVGLRGRGSGMTIGGDGVTPHRHSLRVLAKLHGLLDALRNDAPRMGNQPDWTCGLMSCLSPWLTCGTNRILGADILLAGGPGGGLPVRAPGCPGGSDAPRLASHPRKQPADAGKSLDRVTVLPAHPGLDVRPRTRSPRFPTRARRWGSRGLDDWVPGGPRRRMGPRDPSSPFTD